MAGKDGEKVTLKGPATEKAVKDYVNSRNRPYVAADIAANMGNVSKPNAQKILVALAEKGDISQRTIKKQTYFVANQAEISDIPEGEIKAIGQELVAVQERIKALKASNQVLAAESTASKTPPSNTELPQFISLLRAQLHHTQGLLAPHLAQAAKQKGGGGPMTEEELAKLDEEFKKWREEWKKRKGAFRSLWSQLTDPLTPAQTTELEEQLGYECDSEEHLALEAGPLCNPPRMKLAIKIGGAGLGKRRGLLMPPPAATTGAASLPSAGPSSGE